jgi:hypothetical protein
MTANHMPNMIFRQLVVSHIRHGETFINQLLN